MSELSIVEQMHERLAKQTPEEKERMRRCLSGEDNNDLLRREDVIEVIRGLRTNPVPSKEFQAGLSAVMKGIHDLKIHGQAVCHCMTELEEDGYSSGGPMSGKPRPPRCELHPKQDGKTRQRG